MALQDPVAAYNAANNMEAHFVRDALLAAGVEAYVVEDVSQAGSWLAGLVPEIHKPQVFVERADLPKAKPVLDDFEARAARQRGESGGAERDIEAVCEECGARSAFPASQQGSVQQCPRCAAYMDVGEADLDGDWASQDAAEPDADADDEAAEASPAEE